VGIRRHQATLVIVGFGLVGGWIIESRAPLIELMMGLMLLAMAVPSAEGLTVAERVSVALMFVFRQRWMVVRAESQGRSLMVRARGTVQVAGFELVHCGRLDLAGTDYEIAQRLIDLTKSLTTSGGREHASIHVRAGAESASTLLTLRAGELHLEGWRPDTELVRESLHLGADGCSGILERWDYVRLRDEVVRIFRLRDFNSANESRAILEKVQQSPGHPGVALHFDVLPSERAQRVASRAVHRMGSDHAASAAVGFRRSARSKRSLQRLAQREELVASGEALMCLGVFVTVRASSLTELREQTRELQRSCKESGLRVERGRGRQLPWYCLQLPGGPGW
jgi:hypothetical protein